MLQRLAADGFGNQPPVAYRALDFLEGLGLVHRIRRLNAFTACMHPGEAHSPVFLICRTCQAVAEAPGAPVGTVAPYACADASGQPMFKLPVPSGGVVPLLAYAEGAYMARMVELILRQAGGEAGGLEAVHEADMAEGLKAMAVEGHGLAFLPASAVRNELRTGRLVPAAAPGSFEVTMDIRLYRERPETARHTKPMAQALWAFLQAGGA